MVSINTSSSFPGNPKPGESVNDNDVSGLENIFASMLTVIDEENNLNGSNTSDIPDDIVLFLKKIKNNLDFSQEPLSPNDRSKSHSEILSSNILQIYKAYKTVIDEAMKITNDSTISFDLDKMLGPIINHRNTLATNPQKVESSASIPFDNYDEISGLPYGKDLATSIEDFSELEMQRIKASMKQNEQVNLDLNINSKKKKSNSKNNQPSTTQNIASDTELKEQLLKDKVASFGEQNNADFNRANKNQDFSKAESLIDHTQTSTKSVANKISSADQNLQTSQNDYQTQLKLLEKNWGKELAKIIEKALLSGTDKIDISLDPQKLGKMHLTLSVVNNQTSIFVSTESAAASLILTSAEDRLAQMFESSGYKLSNFQANSNGKHGSNKNGSETKQQKTTRAISIPTEPALLDKKGNGTSYNIDGRKIINIIA